MYTIIEKSSGQWVSESCVMMDKDNKPHFTHFFPDAAVFHSRGTAYWTMKKIQERFDGRNFKTSKIDV